MDRFVINMDWLKEHTQCNPFTWSLTRDQAAIVGEPFPLTSGWRERTIGKTLTPDQVKRFEARLTIKKAKRYAPDSLDDLWG